MCILCVTVLYTMAMHINLAHGMAWYILDDEVYAMHLNINLVASSNYL